MGESTQAYTGFQVSAEGLTDSDMNPKDFVGKSQRLG